MTNRENFTLASVLCCCCCIGPTRRLLEPLLPIKEKWEGWLFGLPFLALTASIVLALKNVLNPNRKSSRTPGSWVQGPENHCWSYKRATGTEFAESHCLKNGEDWRLRQIAQWGAIYDMPRTTRLEETDIFKADHGQNEKHWMCFSEAWSLFKRSSSLGRKAPWNLSHWVVETFPQKDESW